MLREKNRLLDAKRREAEEKIRAKELAKLWADLDKPTKSKRSKSKSKKGRSMSNSKTKTKKNKTVKKKG